MERGEVISHRFILFINAIALILIIGFTGINNLDINLAKLLLGFSPSILALIINAFMDKHIREPYIYLFIPFISVTLFIIFGILLLTPVLDGMDIETLSSINFIFTIIFAFIYYFSSRQRRIRTKKTKSEIPTEIKEIKKEEIVREKKIEPSSEKVVHHVHHVHHDKETVIEKEVEKETKKNPYIEELRNEFNIVNINQEKILDALNELSTETKDANIQDILGKLEKKHVFFASDTGEKYHKPLCIVINHINHEKIIAFKDESEAKMEGYKPCRVCMPEK